jgi:RNA polymerase sigma-70 factor, ECF subfamily
MLERLGRPSEAAKAYDRAAALARTDAAISFLSLRRTKLTIDPRETPDE